MAKVAPFSPELQLEWDQKLESLGLNLSTCSPAFQEQQNYQTWTGHPILKKVPHVRACDFTEKEIDLRQVSVYCSTLLCFFLSRCEYK